MSAYTILIFFVALGALIAASAIIASRILGYKTEENDNKREPYECGESHIGNARFQFRVGFYLYALLFLIFDIESLFLFPAVKIFNLVSQNQIPEVTPSLLSIELAVFVLILTTGLVYAWKKDVFKWD